MFNNYCSIIITEIVYWPLTCTQEDYLLKVLVWFWALWSQEVRYYKYSTMLCHFLCVPSGNVEWQDSQKTRCLVMWRSPSEWGKLIYQWVRNFFKFQNNVLTTDLRTFYRLRIVD